MEKELRRGSSTLQMLGIGVIMFAFWDLLKPSLMILLGTSAQTSSQSSQGPVMVSTFMAIVILLILLLIFLNFPLRLYMGLSAMAEGRGKPKGWAYVNLSMLTFGIQSALYVFSLWNIFFNGQTETENLAAALLETCSLATTGQLAFTAIRVKRLRKKLARKEA